MEAPPWFFNGHIESHCRGKIRCTLLESMVYRVEAPTYVASHSDTWILVNHRTSSSISLDDDDGEVLGNKEVVRMGRGRRRSVAEMERRTNVFIAGRDDKVHYVKRSYDKTWATKRVRLVRGSSAF